MFRHIYLDHNATTPIHPEVFDAMIPYLRDQYGNPSSRHWAGKTARQAVEQARREVAELINCETEEVFFTSCATESNNTAIKGVAAALRSRGKHLITTAVEHPSVFTPCMYLENFGYSVTVLDVDGEGMIDLDELKQSITDQTILVSVMLANNETGTIFPVEDVGAIAAERGVIFHCDAVQAVGKIPLDWKRLNIGLLSLSGHKLNAPKGIGALIIRKGTKIHALLHGGSQEKNRRSGTENVAGIVGLGTACRIARETMDAEYARLLALRRRLEREIKKNIPLAKLNGHPDKRLANTCHFSFPHIEADALVSELDKLGIAVSSGSACSSGALKGSPVLAAMGLDLRTAVSHLRISLGGSNSDADIDQLLAVLPGLVERLRNCSGSKEGTGCI